MTFENISSDELFAVVSFLTSIVTLALCCTMYLDAKKHHKKMTYRFFVFIEKTSNSLVEFLEKKHAEPGK
jgi:hypothetical protein